MTSASTILLTADELDQFPDDGKRREIIGGELHVSPAAARIHQLLSMRLSHLLYEKFNLTEAGEAYATPDVRFTSVDLVQPDLVVLRADRLSIYEGHTVNGAPDIAIEILSPSNSRYDEVEKKRLYERHGVPEYWIVDPIRKQLTIFRNVDGVYQAVEAKVGLLRSTAIVDFTIDPEALFAGISGK